ncbi:PDGLE domain-containing protein [Haloplanus sp. C73]|uniref:PDGLE domain-containing protein n=1 Tax=Haloplanus sp. C73 TaxID=3421641 RepID=UPI003EB930B6
MSVRAVGRWQRRSIGGLLCLVALAPVFAWAANRVGYAEPMDNAVELAGASSEIVSTGASLFSGYALPGFGPYAGTFGGALLGTALTFAIALGLGRLLAAGN